MIPGGRRSGPGSRRGASGSRSIDDDHPADRDPLGAGLEFIDTVGISARVWPREIASRAARAFVFLADRDDDRRNAFSQGGPVIEEEARDIIDRWLDADSGDILLKLLEALVGPSIVCDAAIKTMEKYDKEQWTGADFDRVRETAGYVKEGLDALKMPSYAKTTGSRGIHVYVPIRRGPTQKEVWAFAKAFAIQMEAARPKRSGEW